MEKVGLKPAYSKGTWQALKATYENEGFRGFYKGNGTHFIKKVPFAAIKFYSYERFKQVLLQTLIPWIMTDHHTTRSAGCQDMEEDRCWSRSCSRIRWGSSRGIFFSLQTVALTYPLDLVHTLLSVQTSQQPKYRGIYGTLSTIAREEGISQWYRGVSVTMIVRTWISRCVIWWR